MVRKTDGGIVKANKPGSADARDDVRRTSRKVAAGAKGSAGKRVQGPQSGSRLIPAQPASTQRRATAAAPQAAPKGMLRAGLKALSDVRDDVVARQSRMFESLLGLGQPGIAKAAAALPDSFGFRKFEDVFDERVGRALERLGMPSAAAIQELSDRVDALAQSVERLDGAKAPHSKASSGKNTGPKRRAPTPSSKSARGPRQDP